MADNKKAVCGGFLVGDGLEFEGKTLYATGTGGTEDYTQLENKPSINSVELNGNKTLEDLGIASKEAVTTLEDAVDNIVDDIETIDTTLQQHTDKIAANSSRIDTFTHLPEGSTTGDAELADIRVGYDGKTYSSAGSAVREQVSGLKQDLAQVSEDGKSLEKKVLEIAEGNKVINADFNVDFKLGEVHSSNQYHIDNPSPTLYTCCSKEYYGNKYTVEFDDSVYKILCVLYDNNHTYINNTSWITKSPFDVSYDNGRKTVLEIRRVDGAKINPSEAIANTKIKNNIAVKLVNESELADLRDEILANDKPISKSFYDWTKFEKPVGFDMDIPFNIFTDGHAFITDFDSNMYKNKGGNTYYVSPSGKSSNNGTKDSPYSFYKAYTVSTDGDTIILLEGDYNRDNFDWGNTKIQKSINIIGDGKVRIFAGEISKFTKTTGRNNVYQATRSGAKRVIDYGTITGKYVEYTMVSSIDVCDQKDGSYFIDGSVVYVHSLDGDTPQGKVCITIQSEKFFDVDNATQNLNVYIGNIALVGKYDGILVNRSNVANDLFVVFEDVSCFYCGQSIKDSFMTYGGTVIFNRCTAFGSHKDGFNHNGVNSSSIATGNRYIEIDCVGCNCGIGQTGENQNGTTGHIGSKVLRINGKYYNNFGANVADVQDGTQSVNLGCIAFDSSGVGTNENFSAQQSGTTMWLYGCVGVGATKDLSCISGSEMNLEKCTYKTKMGAGVYNENNTLPFDIYTLYKLSELR